MLHAAREHGVRAVGVTLSEPQAELARERVRDAGLSDRVEIRVADYRELDDGPYDKIAWSACTSTSARRARRVLRVDTALVRRPGLLLNHGIARIAPHVKRRPWASDATFLSALRLPRR